MRLDHLLSKDEGDRRSGTGLVPDHRQDLLLTNYALVIVSQVDPTRNREGSGFFQFDYLALPTKIKLHKRKEPIVRLTNTLFNRFRCMVMAPP